MSCCHFEIRFSKGLSIYKSRENVLALSLKYPNNIADKIKNKFRKM